MMMKTISLRREEGMNATSREADLICEVKRLEARVRKLKKDRRILGLMVSADCQVNTNRDVLEQAFHDAAAAKPREFAGVLFDPSLTDVKPTEEGWYWFREDGSNEAEILPIWTDRGFVWTNFGEVTKRSGRWSARIPSPEAKS